MGCTPCLRANVSTCSCENRMRLWCVVMKLKTLKKGCPGRRFRQWAVALDSSQVPGGLRKL